MSKENQPPNKKKRGLSADDKRKVILNLYHEKCEPFNLKELETTASKLVIFCLLAVSTFYCASGCCSTNY
jgi:hypothetical protein